MAFHDIVEAQRKYFLSDATLPLEKRKEALNTLKKLMQENKEDLGKVVHKDLKRHTAYTEAMEIQATLGEIDYFLKHLDEWAAPTKVDTSHSPIDSDAEAFIVKDPKGVVLLIAPWNYPVSMCFWPLVAILGAGNTCIIKPSELAPNSSDLFETLAKKYFDPRHVTIVQGGVDETTDLLKEKFDHIMYTGAPPVAKIVMAAAAKHLTPVTLELGGKCPVVVEPDADIKKTAERIVAAKWTNVGQTCITPDYILTPKNFQHKLATAIEEELKKKYGNEPKEHPLYSRIINERHFDRLVDVLDRSQGKVLVKHGADHDREDKFIAPHVLEVEKDDAFMEHEIFGPFLPILPIDNFEDALNYIKTHEKPLASYLFTNDEEKIKQFLAKTTAGGVTINDVHKHIGVKTLPFGGVGNSGMGRYNGKYGFDTFTHEKSVLKRKL
jgi:acyl-CoA reductase-like NAD-dependent aldehyde dehydrogenase